MNEPIDPSLWYRRDRKRQLQIQNKEGNNPKINKNLNHN